MEVMNTGTGRTWYVITFTGYTEAAMIIVMSISYVGGNSYPRWFCRPPPASGQSLVPFSESVLPIGVSQDHAVWHVRTRSVIPQHPCTQLIPCVEETMCSPPTARNTESYFFAPYDIDEMFWSCALIVGPTVDRV